MPCFSVRMSAPSLSIDVFVDVWVRVCFAIGPDMRPPIELFLFLPGALTGLTATYKTCAQLWFHILPFTSEMSWRSPSES